MTTMPPKTEMSNGNVADPADAISTIKDPDSIATFNEASISNDTEDKIGHSPGPERAMLDRGHEDDTLIDDEVGSVDHSNSVGPKKKKKSKSKSQRAAVIYTSCLVCFGLCVLILNVGLESGYWV